MNSDYVKRGIVKALRDLKSAEHLLIISKDNLYTDTICFNSQQAAEKLLKTYLVSKKMDFPKTHDLQYLLKLCMDMDNSFSVINVDGLTNYAVDLRYPETYYIPSIDEARKAFDKAVKIKDFILDKLNEKENDLNLFS